MKKQPNSTEPTFKKKQTSIKNTLTLIAGVFTLTKKVLML